MNSAASKLSMYSTYLIILIDDFASSLCAITGSQRTSESATPNGQPRLVLNRLLERGFLMAGLRGSDSNESE